MPEEPSLLATLAGETLAAVVFVTDYVQLDFSGPRLSLYVWPVVARDGRRYAYGDAGYRDALCGLLLRPVTGAADSAAEGLVLRFGADAVVVRPRARELTGAEIAMLQTNDAAGRWEVWRPGEGSFAELA